MVYPASDLIVYYEETPILFYQERDLYELREEAGLDRVYFSGGSILIKAPVTDRAADAQTDPRYQELLTEFLHDPVYTRFADSEWALWTTFEPWNELLVQNGFERERAGAAYYAMFCKDGVCYTVESNLDFDTFAAIVASLVK